MKQAKQFFIAGIFFGATGVMAGAFGAHFLGEKLNEDQLHTFETAVRYQMYHALALCIVALLISKSAEKLYRYAGNCFIAGVIIFSGSLYMLSTSAIWSGISVDWLGPLTPVGGLSLIAGWIILGVGVAKYLP